MNGQTTEAKTVLDQGYLIVRGAIDPEQLEPVRATAELFLDRARERSRGDPNVGWDAHRVPHPALYDFIDRDTATLFDPLASDRVLDVNRRLMDAPEAGLNTASLFTEPRKPLGKIFQWHRDSVLRPSSPLPLGGLQADCQANAPGVLSWNIALHDDDSLWVVPGSNRRGNTAAEQEVLDRPAQLADEPLPGARRCELAAGDAVVFDAAMVHSGSNDADCRRRTFNVAYREFGGPVLAHSRATYWKPDLFGSLTPETARRFERFERLLGEERDTIEGAFRAVIERDGIAFREHLARLHPGRIGRMVCVVQLHKVAHALWKLAEVSSEALSDADYQAATLDHAGNRWRTAALLERFTGVEVNRLRDGFADLDRRLRPPGHQPAAGGSTEPTGYDQYEMPRDSNVDDFVASWPSD